MQKVETCLTWGFEIGQGMRGTDWWQIRVMSYKEEGASLASLSTALCKVPLND